MKLVIHPPVEPERLDRIAAAAGPMTVVNADDEAHALRHMPDADAFFGKITPRLLAAASRLRWVQAPTASLEHYLFPELVAHPCVLTNMRGLFSDVIADQVMGYVICFARNLHVYILQAAAGRWAPVGGEAARVGFASGPGTVNDIDRAHRHLADATLGVVGLGAIGREVARRAAAFGMRVVAVDPRPMDRPPEVAALWPRGGVAATAGAERLRRDRGTAHAAVGGDVSPAAVPADEARRVPHQHRPRGHRRAGRPRRGTGGGRDRGRGTGRVRDRAVAARSRPVEDAGRVILTPHVAGYSPRIAGRHLEVLLDNVGRFVRGEPLRNVVDKEKWY